MVTLNCIFKKMQNSYGIQNSFMKTVISEERNNSGNRIPRVDSETPQYFQLHFSARPIDRGEIGQLPEMSVF